MVIARAFDRTLSPKGQKVAAGRVEDEEMFVIAVIYSLPFRQVGLEVGLASSPLGFRFACRNVLGAQRRRRQSSLEKRSSQHNWYNSSGCSVCRASALSTFVANGAIE